MTIEKNIEAWREPGRVLQTPDPTVDPRWALSLPIWAIRTHTQPFFDGHEGHGLCGHGYMVTMEGI